MLTFVEEIHTKYDYSLNPKGIFDKLIMVTTVTEEHIWHIVSKIVHIFQASDKKGFTSLNYKYKIVMWHSSQASLL